MPNLPAGPTVDEPRTKPKHETRTRLLPPYNVVLANDDHHSMEFVVDVLRKVFGMSLEKATQLMLEAHKTGRAIIWTGPKEVAELKADQVHTCREVRGPKDLGPLECTIEPAPGA